MHVVKHAEAEALWQKVAEEMGPGAVMFAITQEVTRRLAERGYRAPDYGEILVEQGASVTEAQEACLALDVKSHVFDIKPETLCNACGESCMVHSGAGREDYSIQVTASGGYNSPALSDGTTYAFALCEWCLRDLMLSLVRPPELGDYMGIGGPTDLGEPLQDEEAVRRRALRRAR